METTRTSHWLCISRLKNIFFLFFLIITPGCVDSFSDRIPEIISSTVALNASSVSEVMTVKILLDMELEVVYSLDTFITQPEGLQDSAFCKSINTGIYRGVECDYVPPSLVEGLTVTYYVRADRALSSESVTVVECGGTDIDGNSVEVICDLFVISSGEEDEE